MLIETVTQMDQYEAARRWFAEDLRVSAPIVHNQSLVDAFAKVPRESFLGDGPWRIHPRLRAAPNYTSKTSEPEETYHDVLVSIDESRDLNNGQPSLWAYVFDNLDIGAGSTVLQVGAGVGYYTAILAELVWPGGQVISYEIDKALSHRARDNLRGYTNVEVVSGDATTEAEFRSLDVVVASAGATHVPGAWLSNLAENGQMMVPITGEDQWGFMLKVRRKGHCFHARSLGPCGFYHCHGARHANEEASLTRILKKTKVTELSLDRLHLGAPTKDDANVWFAGNGFWLSAREVPQGTR
ncbi:MAG: rRNA adenine N-6-methyltransferase family protein [Pseudomonadota bacterium]